MEERNPTVSYAQLRLLSIDVALGALSGGVLASAFLGVRMPAGWYVILPLSVWVVYTWDHLLDAYRLGATASTPRHQFHYRHFRSLLVATGLGALLAVALAAWTLGRSGLAFGLAMGAFSLIHFLVVRAVGSRTSPWLVKELGVAIVYCVGIWGLPALHSGEPFGPSLWFAFGQFFLLAVVNLLEFSLFERRVDEADGHSSFVRAVGERSARRIVALLLLATLGLGAAQLLTASVSTGVAQLLPGSDGTGVAQLLSVPGDFGSASVQMASIALQATYLPMAGILAALLLRPAIFARNERYRAWGDGAFLLPALYLVWFHLLGSAR